jgi:hypothetical protein
MILQRKSPSRCGRRAHAGQVWAAIVGAAHQACNADLPGDDDHRRPANSLS